MDSEKTVTTGYIFGLPCLPQAGIPINNEFGVTDIIAINKLIQNVQITQ
jgi:hypothetical protein